MAYLSSGEISDFGFKAIGKNVLISKFAAIYNPEKIEIGDNSRIDDFVSISGKVKIGRNVHFSIGCNIAGGVLGINIGNFTGLAYGVQVFTRIDDYSGLTLSNPTVPQQFKKTHERKIEIESHCKFATHCIVLPGSQIASGGAFSAKSVISGKTKPHHLYGGNPIKEISKLSQKVIQVESEYLLWEKSQN
jgi:acetyltransferase-like isoleucine patch superfamily enzyme